MPHRALTEPWWTPWPGTGPGLDLLGDIDGSMIVELGCGKGDNAAAFAYNGATVTGVDRDPTKVNEARRRWQDVDQLGFEHADAAEFVAGLAAPIDIACSIFGALSFTRPAPLLGQIASSLRPGGRLAVAARTAPARPLTQHLGAAWTAHAHSPGDWQRLLDERGLHTTRTEVLDHPTAATAPGCLILVAERRPRLLL